jgi:hypothetical protein
MTQESVQRAIFNKEICAHKKQYGGACFTDEEVDCGCLPFTALLLDETHPRIPTRDAGDDLSGSVFAAAGDDYQLCNRARGDPLAKDAFNRIGDIRFLVIGHDPDAALERRSGPTVSRRLIVDVRAFGPARITRAANGSFGCKYSCFPRE